MNVLFLGIPGAGKGTQGRRLAKKLEKPFFGMGDMLRTKAKEETAIGRRLRECLRQGDLFDDQLIVDAFFSHIDCSGGFVAEGVPRNVLQKKLFDSALERKALTLDRVFFLDLPANLALERLSQRLVCLVCGASYRSDSVAQKSSCVECGAEGLGKRDDDTTDTIQKRLTIQGQAIKNLVNLYQKEPYFVTIDASLSENLIAKQLRESL